MSALKGSIPIPISTLKEFDSPTWLPRRWAWVDPLKDVKANIEAVNASLKSRSEVCAEQGRDFEDVLTEQAQEKIIAKENGIDLNQHIHKKEDDDDGHGGSENADTQNATVPIP
jgi:capsid protein